MLTFTMIVSRSTSSWSRGNFHLKISLFDDIAVAFVTPAIDSEILSNKYSTLGCESAREMRARQRGENY
jgi:hypothetical protein